MSEAAPLSPLLEQYEGVRSRYPGHLVLFRVGDFFETFGDDAKLLSKELDLTLTARAPDAKGARVPMAGVPHHALETYLDRLLRKGYRVALCDQVEDARFAKGLVRREVTRVITPGTVVEERVLPGADHNFLVAVDARLPRGSYAAVDLTTGEWFQDRADGEGPESLVATVAGLAPREILVVDGAGTERLRTLLSTEHPRARLDEAPEPAEVDALPPVLAGSIGSADPPIAEVARRLAAYVLETQPRLLPHVRPLPRAPGGRRMRLDGKTLRHLEILAPMNPDDPDGATLRSTWDLAVTAPGRRTLTYWLRNPLADVGAIRARHDAVGALAERGASLLALRRDLAAVADLGRIAGRVAGRRLRPGELGALRDGLRGAGRLAEELAAVGAPLIERLSADLRPPATLLERLDAAVPVDGSGPVPAEPRFRAGFAPEIDAARQRERAALGELAELEREEQAATGIRTLKIGYNQVFGYYLEVSRPNLGRVPAHYRRKQTIAGGERFVTERLLDLEGRVRVARDEAERAESLAWEGLLTEIDAEVPSIHRVSRALGEVDALAGFAAAAQERGLVRPEIDEGSRIQVRDARHPTLDRLLGGGFVPNDIDLDADGERLLVLTGPNMSGKSTYMRTVGLLVVLAQSGSFVPARFARIGVVDALHTRMGFTDAIGRGKSSFLVEMTEVAEILRDAGPSSLVLLDEVGRGTSTFDGLALAWATLRFLHDRSRCRAVLATHYHQLTDLVEGLEGARNAHLAVRERGEEIVFLHRLVPGSTDRSYGLHVARIAGLPPEVTEEAGRLLERLEADSVPLPAKGSGTRRATRFTQAVLLSAEPAPESPLEQELRALDPDRLSPLEALQWLAERRRRLDAPPSEGSAR